MTGAGARSFIHLSHMGLEAQGLGHLLLLFQVHWHGTGFEMEQPGHKLTATWDISITSYTTMLAPKFHDF